MDWLKSLSTHAKLGLLLGPVALLVVVLAMGVDPAVEPPAEPAAPAIDAGTVLDQPEYPAESDRNPAAVDPSLLAAIGLDDNASANDAAEEDPVQQRAEAEQLAAELARLAAEQEQLKQEEAALQQRMLGGDPTKLPAFESSSDAGWGRANIGFCNRSDSEVRVAMVRSNGTFAALTRDSWIADGFYVLAPSQCTYRSFGWMQSLANGYISIFRKQEGYWVPFTTKEGERLDKGGNFEGHERSICWPEAAADVDPDRSCPDSDRNITFTHWFGTSGDVARLTITVTNDSIEKAVTYRE